MNDQWRGTFVAWQRPEFARIYGGHSSRVAKDVDGVQVYVSHHRLLGNLIMYLYCPPEGESWVHGVYKYAQEMRVGKMRVYAPYEIAAFEPHFQGHDLTSVIVLADGEEHIWQRIGDKTRNMIRKGRRNGVMVGVAEGEFDFEQWLRIYEATARFKGFERQPTELIRPLYLQRNLSRLFLARIGDDVIGGCFFLLADYPMYWLGAFDPERREAAVGHVTLWESALALEREGYGMLDLGGISAGDADGPTRFKKSFNGKTMTANIYEVPVSRFKMGLFDMMRITQNLIRR